MPLATMYLMVSSELPSKLLRMPSASDEKRAYSGQTSSTWSRKQWPVPSSSMVSFFSSSAVMRLAPGQRVVHRHRGHEGLVVQRRHGQPGVGEGLGHDGAVELTGAQHLQQLGGEVLLQHQRHLRHALDGVLHQVGQQVGADGVDDAQAQRAADRVLAALGDLLDGRGLLDDLLRLAHDLLAQRRDADLGGTALEDLHVELFLQLLDRHAERGLRHEAGFGRAAEVALARHGDDVLQLGQGHARLCRVGVRWFHTGGA
jgi:hypothetical protein